MIKIHKNILKYIYFILLSLILLATINLLFSKKTHIVENKTIISDKELGDLIYEYALVGGYSEIVVSKKFGFYVIDTTIVDKKDLNLIIKQHNKLTDQILNLALNYFDEKFKREKRLLSKLYSNKDAEIVDSFERIQEIVRLEESVEKVSINKEKFKSRIKKKPIINMIDDYNKNLPLLLFFLILFVFFHFFKKYIFKISKR